MHSLLNGVLAVFAIAASTQAVAQISFYEADGFQGRSFTTRQAVDDFKGVGFNDRASSVVVDSQRWEVCEDAHFSGRCVVLRPGHYASLGAMGLNDRVSSVRSVSRNARVDDGRYAPMPAPVYDARRRGNERLYEASVTSVRAVMGAPEQRCWIEREPVAQPQSGLNVPAAVVGVVIGGILGHQVGGGRGNDLATVGGAVAGGAVGANIGRFGNSPQPATQEVQRCAATPGPNRPDYWDVTYNFRGLEHRLQMTTQPGPTVTVNGRGEPRA
jgi:uncharacterized protein YcfJ